MLVVFSGPSGAGKNAIISGLLERYPQKYSFMPTMTTRAKREGEREGFPYHFVGRREFLDLIRQDKFFEYEQIHTSYYGTHKQILADKLAEGKVLLKDIDVKGTFNLKEGLKGSGHRLFTIFVTAGDKEILRQRLIGRGEKDEDIEIRLKRYESEMAYEKKYNYIIKNIDLSRAIERVHQVITDKSRK
ncbi:MAG: guanylate kinase [Firmicutes bacterium]|nr:guanylate kinase [Bacillota bacterium]